MKHNAFLQFLDCPRNGYFIFKEGEGRDGKSLLGKLREDGIEEMLEQITGGIRKKIKRVTIQTADLRKIRRVRGGCGDKF